MLVPVFLFGVVAGCATRLLAKVAPSQLLWSSAITALFMQDLGAMGEITKMLGGFLEAMLVFGILLKIAGPSVQPFLRHEARGRRDGPTNAKDEPSPIRPSAIDGARVRIRA